MTTLNDNAQKVLSNLRANTESTETRDGVVWGSVYLDNARPSGMSDKVFRAALSQLAKAGLYKVIDGYAFGDVRLEGE